jgi:hypothetical protein
VLIRLPEAWPRPLVAVIAMLALAALDLAGAYAAKESVERRSPGFACFGLACFCLLFWVYASSLRYADLAPVTFGWIVLLQIGVLLLDRHRYAVPLPPGAWLAVTVMVAAQAWLLFASHTVAAEPTSQPASSQVADDDGTAGGGPGR